MKSHELAKLLLEKPDLEVCVIEEEFNEYSESSEYHICAVKDIKNDSEKIYLIHEEIDTIYETDSPDKVREIEKILYLDNLFA